MEEVRRALTSREPCSDSSPSVSCLVDEVAVPTDGLSSTSFIINNKCPLSLPLSSPSSCPSPTTLPPCVPYALAEGPIPGVVGRRGRERERERGVMSSWLQVKPVQPPGSVRVVVSSSSAREGKQGMLTLVPSCRGPPRGLSGRTSPSPHPPGRRAPEEEGREGLGPLRGQGHHPNGRFRPSVAPEATSSSVVMVAARQQHNGEDCGVNLPPPCSYSGRSVAHGGSKLVP